MGNKSWTTAGTDTAGTGRDAKREAKRRAVLQAGARLFNDQGYEQTSLDEIAAALKITKRTIYYYVESKEDILFGCHLLGLEVLGEVMAQSQDESLPVVDRIALLIRGYCAWVSTDLGATIAMVREQSLSPARRSALRASKAEVDFQLRSLIAMGMQEGSLRPCDPRLVTAAVFGALNWIPHWNRVDSPVPQEVIAEQYLQLMFSGMTVAQDAAAQNEQDAAVGGAAG
ncbi:TetR/AcrR family transcriptional regulator [Pseudophaeobacter leonis]|uniref:TetR/AcrR family transcriptional regulator n=1 Tax=Pseudophaeobacter leonis TaxID=1144477 RepID=UPI0009F6D3EA|nr:TetR/AcrR family transcriptional regulator [Pseudophaeobacter leonis]